MSVSISLLCVGMSWPVSLIFLLLAVTHISLNIFITVLNFVIVHPGICIVVVSISAAVVAIIKLPVVASNAEVAETALRAVFNLAGGNAENSAKLGSAGACAGGYI